MKLKKDKWEYVKIGDVCEKAKTIDIRKQNGFFNYIDIGSINSESKRISKIQKINWNVASSRARQIVTKGDTLFSTVRVNLERVAYIDYEMNDQIASTGFTVLRATNRIDKQYLFYSVSSPHFIAKLSKLQKGTAYPAVSDRIVFNEKIPIPTIKEQKRIASLFQEIDKTLQIIGGQENNLKNYWKRIIGDITSDGPILGKLLRNKKLTEVKFRDVTNKLIRKVDPISYGLERIVAGENLDSEDFKIRTWGIVGKDFLGPAFHVLFKPGDILYGSRRTYLKKVALADFEGVCANTTFVIRAKEDVLIQDLLKNIMLSERFTEYSIGVSKGSTNPYINWKDLDNFKFKIPDLKTQREIVRILDGIWDIIEKLKIQKGNIKALKQNLSNEIFT